MVLIALNVPFLSYGHGIWTDGQIAALFNAPSLPYGGVIIIRFFSCRRSLGSGAQVRIMMTCIHVGLCDRVHRETVHGM